MSIVTNRLQCLGNLLDNEEYKLLELRVLRVEEHAVVLADQLHAQLRNVVLVGLIEQLNPRPDRPRQ